jgi:electron transfer flavoprotein beta subunit
MRILVCIKQIPENLEQLQINSQKTLIRIPEKMKFRMNRFDAHAVEAAVQLKEKIVDTTIDIVTVGPASSEAIVKRAMGMGADNGLIIHIESGIYLSPSKISAILAQIASQKHYDIIFTGIMSEDQMNAQTGQMLAARLNIPSISGVVDLQYTNKKLLVVRECEGGIREHLAANIFEMNKGILLTIQAGINEPRYPSISALLKANAKKLFMLDIDELYSEPLSNDQSILTINKAERIRQGVFIKGSIEAKARQFIEIMKERNFLP